MQTPNKFDSSDPLVNVQSLIKLNILENVVFFVQDSPKRPRDEQILQNHMLNFILYGQIENHCRQVETAKHAEFRRILVKTFQNSFCIILVKLEKKSSEN